MTKLKNDRLIRALLYHPVDRPPIWLMRQAGRYLPEYRQVREQAGDFMTLCRTPDLACEVTMQPIRRFGFDAAIIFSDILTIPDAMGLGLHFIEGSGPHFEHPVRTTEAITKLKIDVETELDYVYQAVATTAKALNNEIPLIGFAGSPWTLATYMVEGGPSKTFSLIKKMLYTNPQALNTLLIKLADAVAEYLNLQIKAGANAVMIFDTWGGILTGDAYAEFSLSPMRRIVEQLTRKYEGQRIPVTLYTKNGGQWLEQLADSSCDALGIDWMTDLASAKQRVGRKVALQGNLDPSVLYGSPETIQAEVEKMLAVYKDDPGYVVNLGHGIYPDVPPEHVQVMVEAVKNYHCVKV